MTKLLIASVYAFLFAVAVIGVLLFFAAFNIKKEYRYKHHRHIIFLLSDIAVGVLLYLGSLVAMTLSEDAQMFFNKYEAKHVIPVLVLVAYLLFKILYRVFFNSYAKKSADISEDRLPPQYYEKDGVFFLSPYYSTLEKVCRYSALVIIVLLSIGFAIIHYNNTTAVLGYEIRFVPQVLVLLPLVLMELSYFFGGQVEDKVEKSNKKDDLEEKEEITWQNLDEEYHRLWKKQLLGRYHSSHGYEKKKIKKAKKLGKNEKPMEDKEKDLLYSRILSPILQGNDIIIENCMLQNFSDIIVPIVNIMFTASKRMMFVCDNYATVKQCEKWFEELEIKSNSANSNIVIDVLNYENAVTVKMDGNVDIYIGTVDLALNSNAIFKNIDVVFCINIDKIISENALNLNLLASVLSSNRYDNVQYILFGNRVNGLKQTAAQVFMRSDFDYQVVGNSNNKTVSTAFWSTEKGWLQSAILPGFASQYLGQLLPLAIPAFKHDIQHVDVVSLGQSFTDQMVSLQTAQQPLKHYLGKDIVNIDEAIGFSENENFVKINKNAVVVAGDSINNAALVLLNWMKYADTNMFLNVVSSPYLLRDYIIANMDFFVNNVEAIGTILPIPKTNIKLSVYRLINQLCYGNVEEEVLLREIKNHENYSKVDIFENDQVYFVTEALQELIKRAFGANVFLVAFLTSEKDKTMDSKRYYKLLDSIKNELPERLFKNITFIDAEQMSKVLARVPVFELYQNYLEGQYVSFDDKYYLIDKIDYDNGVVELIYSSINTGVLYRQCRQIGNIVHKGVIKELPVTKVKNSVLTKRILCADIEVNTDGYYEFANAISLVPGGFGYKTVDAKQKGLRRNYNSTNVLAVNITSKAIDAMTKEERFKLSFTLSVLLNEMFETLFCNIRQYILARSVVASTEDYQAFSDEELLKMYCPIVDASVGDGITIYITEDTELEKGITDTIAANFDTMIMRLLFDYLFWLLKQEDETRVEKWFANDNGEFINSERCDKMDFLKYGFDELSECLDLDAAFNCLYELILKGNDTLTYSRGEFIKKRKRDNPFNPNEVAEEIREMQRQAQLAEAARAAAEAAEQETADEANDAALSQLAEIDAEQDESVQDDEALQQEEIEVEAEPVDNESEPSEVDDEDEDANETEEDSLAVEDLPEEIPCPHCGTMNKSVGSFCRKCGSPLK